MTISQFFVSCCLLQYLHWACAYKPFTQVSYSWSLCHSVNKAFICFFPHKAISSRLFHLFEHLIYSFWDLKPVTSSFIWLGIVRSLHKPFLRSLPASSFDGYINCLSKLAWLWWTKNSGKLLAHFLMCKTCTPFLWKAGNQGNDASISHLHGNQSSAGFWIPFKSVKYYL